MELTFPSVEWFARLGELMEANRAVHEHVGEIDCTCVWTVFDADGQGTDRHFQTTFELYSLTDVQEINEDDRVKAHFILETDVWVWKEMLENIADGGGKPDLEHSLNRLSLPGVPIRLWAEDPLDRDMFFRFNGSLQEFVNESYKIPTKYLVE
ncbi:MAG TPA: hypothetical protein VHL53_04445 [Acidimicrobiia bacterium]|nr:hypothetical protein [Acidimicrobiia bacterium]